MNAAALISESSSSSVQVGMGFPRSIVLEGFSTTEKVRNVENSLHSFFKNLNVTHIQSSVKMYQESRRLMNCECRSSREFQTRTLRLARLGNADNYEVPPPNLYLLRKNVNESTGFPTDIESPPGRPDGKHSLSSNCFSVLLLPFILLYSYIKPLLIYYTLSTHITHAKSRLHPHGHRRRL